MAAKKRPTPQDTISKQGMQIARATGLLVRLCDHLKINRHQKGLDELVDAVGDWIYAEQNKQRQNPSQELDECPF